MKTKEQKYYKQFYKKYNNKKYNKINIIGWVVFGLILIYSILF
jgi:hypothetical protein